MMDSSFLIPYAKSTQALYEKASNQISSGLRISKPSDDPMGMAKTVALKSSLSTRGVYLANAATAQDRLSAQEQAIGRATDALMSARDTMTQAGGGTLNSSDLKVLAKQIDSAYQEYLAAANTKTAQGGYIFSGYSDKQPFTQTTGAGVYAGDTGVRQLTVGDNNELVKLEENGQDVFQPGTPDDLFKTLSDLKTTLESGALPANLNSELAKLDKGIDHLTDVRGGIGARMARMDSLIDFQRTAQTNDKQALSSIEDTNMAEASVNFANAQTQLESTYKVIASMNESRKTVLNMLG